MEESGKVRLVRCPKCQNLLPELADYSVYECGGCGAVLKAKHEGCGGGSMWETSDEGEEGGGDHAKSGKPLGKGVVDMSDNSDVDVRSNGSSLRYDGRGSEKAKKGHERFLTRSDDGNEKGVLENAFDVNENKDEGKSIGREQQEQKYQMDREKGSKFSRRMNNWPNEERGEMEGFWRKSPADIEGARFSNLNCPDEGTSNSYSRFPYNYGEQWRNDKGMDGMSRVQHLEQDRAELLRKLDELTNQLNYSSEAINNPKEKFCPDGRTVPPDPYGSTNTWFPEGPSGLNRTSRQIFGPPNKHVAAPPYFNYPHDPYAYTTGHEMAMLNFHPSMHNPNYIPGYGDPFAPPMLRRGPHQFPQQPMHPYFPGRYADTGPEPYAPYAHNAMPHPPSCSCFHCNKRRGSVPAPPPAFTDSRFSGAPNDSILYRQEIPGAFGPHVRNSGNAIPPVSFHEKQLHTRRPGDFNSAMGGLAQSRPQKVMPASGGRRCFPISGGSPFITCCDCFELLQLPKKALVVMKKHQQKVRCGACSSEITLAIIDKKLVVSLHSEMKEFTTTIDDTSNEVMNSHISHSHGHVNTSGVNFSSDDYSGYDFLSVDKESPALATDLNVNSGKLQDMQSFHSSSPSTSEDENSPEVMIAPGEATKFVHQQTKVSLSPPPSGSTLEEHFDYSSNNHEVNRFGKGNQSNRLEQEKAKIDKITSRQNSLKEIVLATELDVHDYPNTRVSQESGDTSREHDHSRSNKGGESFLVNIIKKGFRDFSQSNETDDHGKIKVTVNGQPLSDRVIKKAEKLAGPIRPGNYWYDFRAGFWGAMGGPCLGIIPSFIEEFNYPMPDKCAGGDTGVFVNGRELHEKDLNLLSGRGLPHDSNRSYIIEISGRVLDEDTGEELNSLGKLAPTVEKAKHGFGMKVPKAAA
ncbi:hypothetical protein RIF29_16450 [Crotalaria pallida]|uniref:Zinc-ribbon domain-containing protein n=1 Tax=Crotalaria pallida TaxID=3830 RepID=A0AAN9FF37_CROPI